MEELRLPVKDLRLWLTTEAEGIRFSFVTGRASAAPEPAERQAFRFADARALLALPFCPADQPVARLLALMPPLLTACFWDFDGTLADTYPGLTRRLTAAAADCGISLDPVRGLDLMKISLSHALHTLSEAHGVPLAALEEAWGRSKSLVSLRRTPPLPGIPETLRALSRRGCRHFLCTHNDLHALDFLREQGLLSLFTDFATREDGFPRKPAPDALLHLCRKHGLDPAACLMIGDRPLDVQAGQNAGMLSCLLDPEDRFPGTPCELRVRRAEELTALP